MSGRSYRRVRSSSSAARLRQKNVKAHVESVTARRRGRSSTAKFSSAEGGRRLRECVDVPRLGHNDFAEAQGGELRHFDAEQGFLEAGIDEEIYIEIPKEYQEFP